MQKYLFIRAGVLVLCATALFAGPVFADGIFRNGFGARSMAMGGADVGYASDPLGAMSVNPAGLGFLPATELDLSLNGEIPYGHFSRPPDSDSDMNKAGDVFPDAAFALHFDDFPVTFGFSFVTDSGSDANWNYIDPNVNGVSYGEQRDNSKIVLFRSAFGAGMNLGDKWSIGVNVGLDYNQNELQTPYVFQSAPGLAGAKTLLDLRTDGFGYNALVGVLFRPMEKLQFGLSYKTETTIFSQGDANGNAGAQVGVNPFLFHYDAQVKNVIPRTVSGGASWQFTPKWRLALQLDWINWADAFNTLPVSLHNGSNPGLPGTINDNIPLDWRNEFVYRAGLEYGVTTNLSLRGGYCYGQSPVPDTTLTPLTAAIMEHTLTAGAGYHWKRCQFDFAYQWDIPVARNIGNSSLLDGEYSNSSIRVGAQTLVLSAGIKF